MHSRLRSLIEELERESRSGHRYTSLNLHWDNASFQHVSRGFLNFIRALSIEYAITSRELGVNLNNFLDLFTFLEQRKCGNHPRYDWDYSKIR